MSKILDSISSAMELASQIEYIANELQRKKVDTDVVSRVYGIGSMIKSELEDAKSVITSSGKTNNLKGYRENVVEYTDNKGRFHKACLYGKWKTDSLHHSVAEKNAQSLYLAYKGLQS